MRGDLKPFRFFLLSGCKDKLIEVKGSDHLIWPSELDYGIRANAGAILMRSLPSYAFDDIILDL